jgi:hypothetical protein
MGTTTVSVCQLSVPRVLAKGIYVAPCFFLVSSGVYAGRITGRHCGNRYAGSVINSVGGVYKDVNGHYPEAFGTLFSGNPDAQTLSNKNTWDLIGRDLQLQLQTIDRDNFRDKNDDQNHINRVPDVLRDSFVGAVSGKMIRYRPAKYYPFLTDDKNKDRVAIDSETPPNPDSYQLWSAGPDGKDQFGQTLNNKKSDDIANWKTQ